MARGRMGWVVIQGQTDQSFRLSDFCAFVQSGFHYSSGDQPGKALMSSELRLCVSDTWGMLSYIVMM